MPQTAASGFDMSFLDDGQTAGVFSDIANATDTWNAQLSAHIGELAQLADGETASSVIDQLGQTREGLSAGGYALAASSSALAAQKAADDQWRKAPQDDEIENASRAVAEARKELASADDRAAVAAEAKLRAAFEHLCDLNERRKQADKDFVDSSGKVQGRLREFNPAEGKNKNGKDKKEGQDYGKSPSGKKPEVNTHASPPPSNLRAPAAPGAPAAGPTAPSTSSGSAATGSAAQDGGLSALLQRTAQLQPAQAAQQAPQQQPQTAPAAAAAPSSSPSPVSTPKSKVEGAINADDIPGIAAAPVPVPMGPPGASPTAAAAHAPQPATSGNSAAGLSTDSNVSGRPDGARGAFNQPHTAASGATGTAAGAATGTGTGLNQKGMQAAAAPATGMPMAGMPMAPGAGGGRGGTVKQIQAHQDNNVYDDGVVRGGTIAQNRPDFNEKS